MNMERLSVEFRADAESRNGLRGRAVPYNVPDGRPGVALRITEQTVEPIRYDASIFEPGVFSEWLESNSGRVSFLFQHGDAGESWTDNPMGVNALPLGVITHFEERDDGLHFTAEFASHDLAQAVRELAEMGALHELSFAMRPTSVELRDAGAGMNRHVLSAELWDVSVVVNGQFGDAAAVTEVFAVAQTVKAVTERFIGASISKANAEILTAAVADIRDAATSLASHADALESMMGAGDSDEGKGPDESGTDDDAGDEARTRLAVLEASARLIHLDI